MQKEHTYTVDGIINGGRGGGAFKLGSYMYIQVGLYPE